MKLQYHCGKEEMAALASAHSSHTCWFPRRNTRRLYYYHGHSDLTCMEIRFGIQSRILLAKVLLLR